MAEPISMFYLEAAKDHASAARDFADRLKGWDGDELTKALGVIVGDLAASVEALAEIVTELGEAVGSGEVGGGVEFGNVSE